MDPTIKDFESALAELDTIVRRMEEGDLTLEKSMELYERGLQLSRFCHTTLEAAERYVRAASAPFGPHSDAEWRFLTEVVVRQNADGTYRMHYDPRIAEPYRKSMPEKDLEFWHLYDAIRCPTLVLRGEQSDLLSKETSRQMAERGPRAKVIELPVVGHAPTILHDDQIRAVREFLIS